jgi:hypothetical protein
MATASDTTSRFHNLSDAALADELGRVDPIVKSAEAELKALKDEFKARGLSAASGDAYSMTATEQVAGRLDAKACDGPPGKVDVADLREGLRQAEQERRDRRRRGLRGGDAAFDALRAGQECRPAGGADDASSSRPANKTARLAWAIMKRGEAYVPRETFVGRAA